MAILGSEPAKEAADGVLLLARLVSFKVALFEPRVPKIAANAVLLLAPRVSEGFFVSVFFQGFYSG